jgi:Fic family protein
VGKYISIEMLIEQTKETYYEALRDSSVGWHDNESDYTSFVRYMLGIVLHGYHEFENRVAHLNHRNLSKADRVKDVFDHRLGKIRKADIAMLCPDISETTIERSLKQLLDSGYIEKVGVGKGTAYIKNV